ncbi:MAG: S1 RNA-binding domain-containing protein [Bacilli bacterium]|nr:S1 RNA-binding domain-containing protein [Bacilli bacterium]
MSHSQVGDIIEGTVVRVYPKYAILLFDDNETGLLHISELSNSYVRNFTGYVQVGNIYKVKVIDYDAEKDFMKVSLKAVTSQEKKKPLQKKRIKEEDISFAELEKRLPDWIKEEKDNINGSSNNKIGSIK